jgi:hypothetical protein
MSESPQPNIHIETGNSSDHDLLLTLKAELGTKLDRVIVDVKELKDNVAARVTDLEQEKVSKNDFEDFKAAALRDQDSTADALASLQRLVYIGLGIVIALEFAITVYITYFHP